MTKQDYIKIADAIAKNTDDCSRLYKEAFITTLCIVFYADNSKFDVRRFRKACYTDEYKEKI